MKKLLVFATLAVVCSGCITRWADLTLLSSKNVDVRKAHYVDNKKRVTGETLQHIFIFFPIGQLHIKEAVDRAIESAPGAAALSDASMAGGIFRMFMAARGLLWRGTLCLNRSLILTTSRLEFVLRVRSKSVGADCWSV